MKRTAIIGLTICVLLPALCPAAPAKRERPRPRNQLNRQIEKVRKSDATVTITDEKGEALSGLPLQIDQISHDFLFGCAPEYLIFGASDGAFYRDRWGEEPLPEERMKIWRRRYLNLGLNWSVLNYFYWVDYEPEKGKLPVEQGAMEIANWARANGHQVKGHILVWGNTRQGVPAWLEQMREENPEQVMKELEERVRREVRRFKGIIDNWDVVNEPIRNRWYEEIDPDYIVKTFKWAREENPEATLCLNETHVIPDRERQKQFFEIAKRALDAGAPIDVIGLQGHLRGDWWYSWREVHEIIDYFAQLGLPIRITEFDVPGSGSFRSPIGVELGEMDEYKQAEYLSSFYTIFFSHPAVEGINYWNFYRAWTRDAAMLRDDLSVKPIYRALCGLINTRWRTRLRLTTDSEGKAAFRGFHGKYVVTATSPEGEEKAWPMHLKAKGENLFQFSF